MKIPRGFWTVASRREAGVAVLMVMTLATMGSMRGPRPTMAVAKVIMRVATPERSKAVPTSTNMGSASSGYLATLASKLCCRVNRPNHGRSPPSR